MQSTSICLQQLTGDALVLTPNRRLSAWLVRDYDAHQQNLGKTAWPQLNAMPMSSWFQDCYHQLAAVNTLQGSFPLLLNPDQSRLLWQEIIADCSDAQFDLEGLSALSQQARSLVVRWMLGHEEWSREDSEETRFFQSVHKLYIEALESNGWIDQDQLGEFIIERLPHLGLHFNKVYLHGFNDLDEPSLLSLVKSIQNQGLEVFFTHHQTDASQVATIAYKEYQDELKAALSWAISNHLQSPKQRYCIVVPQLKQQQTAIAKVCEDLFWVNGEKLHGHWQQTINITAGLPLADYPMVAQLLLGIRALQRPLSLAEWGSLLKSPYFSGGMEEFHLRDCFLFYLQKKNRSNLDLHTIISMWNDFLGENHSKEGQSASLLACLDNAKPQIRSSNIKGWLDWLNEFFKITQWLLPRTLDSEEYQIQQRLMQVVYSLADCQLMASNYSFEQFCHELESRVRQTEFQPQTETAPIQVMGVLEAAGIPFDGLWVCGCDSSGWPQTTQANPLLPKQVLKQHEMPGSGAERELKYAKAMLHGFQIAAPSVFFSWSQFEGDTENMLSPLLDNLAKSDAPPTEFVLDSREVEQYRALNSKIEVLESDENGAAFTESSLRGGSGVFKAQSQCPFKAYAEYRLGIKSVDDLEDGVKASDRGSLIHKVLESMFKQIPSYQALQSLLEQPDQLYSLISEITQSELVRFRQRVYLFPDSLYELERDRTINAVNNWFLECETQRAPFQISAIEKKQKLLIEGLEVSLTVDRIDEMADGTLVVIDYKTGLKKPTSWLGERPEEPQLPLYALIDKEATAGIYFGIVKPDEYSWQGIPANNPDFTNTKKRSSRSKELNWDEQVESWALVLSGLANEIKQGVAAVRPTKPELCQYCHLSAVCRVKEQGI